MNDANESLRNYMRMVTSQAASISRNESFPYVCFEDYVLDRGTYFEPTGVSMAAFAALDAALTRWGQKPQIKQCFHNCQMLAIADRSYRLRYCEGIASGAAGVPMLHAWLVVDGTVVDVTWPRPNEEDDAFIIGDIPDGYAYCGVIYETDFIRRRIHENDATVSVIDDWGSGWPEMQKPRINTPRPEPLDLHRIAAELQRTEAEDA